MQKIFKIYYAKLIKIKYEYQYNEENFTESFILLVILNTFWKV